MTPEEQRIEIAKACGYKFDPEWPGDAETPDGDVIPTSYLPFYATSLDAMHEAERLFYDALDTLLGAERASYYTKLLCNLKYPLHATAAEKAERFIETLRVWPTPSTP